MILIAYVAGHRTGNMDVQNMLERDRLESKEISRTQAVKSQVGHDLGDGNVRIGPSDYVAWLDDRQMGLCAAGKAGPSAM